MIDRSFSLLDDAEDVVLAQNQVLFTVDFHFGARVLAEQNRVAGFHVELANLAVLENLAVADGDDFAFDRLLFGGVGDDDPALALLFFLDPLDDDAVLQRSNGHVFCSFWLTVEAAPRGAPDRWSPPRGVPSEALNFVGECDC